MTRLGTELCVIDDRVYFVRAILLVPIIGTGGSFGWGVWTTLSRTNFERYRETFDGDVAHEGPYFGYLSNRLPIYPDTLNLAVGVHLQNGGRRPRLQPADHPLVTDPHEGISWERAVSLSERLMHP